MENERLYNAVQRTLVVGMALSFGLMGLGIIVALVSGTGDATHTIPLTDLPAALLRLDPLALLATGILVLMFIPAVHLIVALRSFLAMGDRRYAALAGVILALLALGATLSFFR